jgi:hypothetical protein
MTASINGGPGVVAQSCHELQAGQLEVPYEEHAGIRHDTHGLYGQLTGRRPVGNGDGIGTYAANAAKILLGLKACNARFGCVGGFPKLAESAAAAIGGHAPLHPGN